MKLVRIIVLVPLLVIILTAPAAAQSNAPSEYIANLMRYYDTQFDFLHGVVCGRSGGEVTGCGVVP